MATVSKRRCDRRVGLRKKEVILLDKEDWKLATKIMLGLGLFLISCGICADCYPVAHTNWLYGRWIDYPYQTQGTILFVVGIAVLIVAACLNERAKTAHGRMPLPVPP